MLMAITLRTFADSDLDALFTWESDPRAVQMAAFTRANPSDHSAFDALIDGGQKRSLSSRPGYALNTGLFR